MKGRPRVRLRPRGILHRWICAAAFLLAFALPAATAQAAQTTIGFDQFPGGASVPAGTIVTTQWEAEGLKLGKAEEFGQPSSTPGNCGSPHVEAESVVPAASKPNYAALATCPPAAANYEGTFGALSAPARGSLSVEVRDLSSSPPIPVTVIAYDASGGPVGEGEVAATSTGWRTVSVKLSGSSKISYFSINAGPLSSQQIAIDNLSFEAIEEHKEEHKEEEHKEGGTGGSTPTPPTATLTLSTPNPHAGEELTLSGGGSTAGTGRIISYGWNFAGGSKVETSTGTNPTAHLMLPPGPHTITLTITNSHEEHSTTHLSVTLAKTALHPPDGGEGECMPTLEVGDAHLLAECIQKQGSGYVISGQLEVNGMLLEPKGGGFLRIKSNPYISVSGGVVTELYGSPVFVKLLNTPIGDMVLGERNLETEPVVLGTSGGHGPLTVLYHGLHARARAAEIEHPTKALFMAIGVGRECSASESKKAGCCPPKNALTACAKLPGNFPLTGQIDVYLNNKEQTIFNVQVGLSLKEVNFEATGQLEIKANLETGIELQSLQFEIGEASLAPIFKVKGASFVYYFPEYEEESKRDSWQAKGTITFGEEIAELEAELAFKKGEFQSAAMKFKANPGVPIYPGISLNEIGASVGVNPLAFGGSLGAKIAELLQLELAFKFREATSTELGFFGGEGKLSYKDDEIATLAADVYTDGYVDAQVKFDLHFPFESSEPVIKVTGEIGFWDEPASGLWQAKGAVYLKLWVIAAEVAGLINNQYAAGCLEGEAFGVSGGIQGRYRFADGNVDGGVFAGSHCTDQLKQYSQKPLVKHSGGFVTEESSARFPRFGPAVGGAPLARTAAAESDSFSLPGGKLGEELRITSPSGTPDVTLVGPKGERFTTPSGASKVTGVRDQYTAVVAPDPHQVLVLLFHPAGGQWGIQAAAGSAAIGSLEVAEDVPPATVRVHIAHRSARRWSLSYNVAHFVAGTHIRFVERGRDSTHVLGTVGGARGNLSFTPATALGRSRSVIAYMVDSEGAVVRELPVARYVAPAAARPGRAPHLRIARQGSSAVITWGSAGGARSYRVKVRGSDGRLETLFRKANARRVVVPNVLGFESFTVAVTAIGKDLLSGPAATVRLAPAKAPHIKRRRHK